MMFALAMLPLTIAAGAGLDFARAMLVRQQMAGALDAAALAVGSTTGLDQTAAQALAQKYFDANYTVDKTAFGSPTVTIPTSGYNSGGSVLITATAPMPTILMKLAGITTLPVTTSTTVVWGQSKLWVALVLDNSGSMCTRADSQRFQMAEDERLQERLAPASHHPAERLHHPRRRAGFHRAVRKMVNVGTAMSSATYLTGPTGKPCPGRSAPQVTTPMQCRTRTPPPAARPAPSLSAAWVRAMTVL